MEKKKTNQKKTYIDPVTGKFAKGNPGGGRPKGSEGFKTKFFRAMEKIASQNNMTADEIEQQLLLVGYKKAKEGEYNFYRDIFDRIYGKPQQHIDHTTDGETISLVNININEPRPTGDNCISEELPEQQKDKS